MKNTNNSFIKNRLWSFKYAFSGLLLLVKTENAIKVHVANTLILTVLGFVFEISITEWIFQYLAIGFLISLEAINTAIEKICDFMEPKNNIKIKIIKDMSAGAVLLAAFFGIVVICMIYIPKFLQFLS